MTETKKTISIGPKTWLDALPTLLFVYENADSVGKKQAREDLERMAKVADMYVDYMMTKHKPGPDDVNDYEEN